MESTITVWDDEAGQSREVAPSEAVAGLLRYAKRLGSGTPAAAVAVRRAILLAQEYGLQIGSLR